jgi:hypothetical protein
VLSSRQERLVYRRITARYIFDVLTAKASSTTKLHRIVRNHGGSTARCLRRILRQHLDLQDNAQMTVNASAGLHQRAPGMSSAIGKVFMIRDQASSTARLGSGTKPHAGWHSRSDGAQREDHDRGQSQHGGDPDGASSAWMPAHSPPGPLSAVITGSFTHRQCRWQRALPMDD